MKQCSIYTFHRHSSACKERKRGDDFASIYPGASLRGEGEHRRTPSARAALWTTLTSTSLTLLLPLSTFTANIYTGKTGPSSNALLDLDTVGKVYGFVRLPRACALESLSMILGMSAVGKNASAAAKQRDDWQAAKCRTRDDRGQLDSLLQRSDRGFKP